LNNISPEAIAEVIHHENTDPVFTNLQSMMRAAVKPEDVWLNFFTFLIRIL
jgi:glutathione peroxidase-family protein